MASLGETLCSPGPLLPSRTLGKQGSVFVTTGFVFLPGLGGTSVCTVAGPSSIRQLLGLGPVALGVRRAKGSTCPAGGRQLTPCTLCTLTLTSALMSGEGCLPMQHDFNVSRD